MTENKETGAKDYSQMTACQLKMKAPVLRSISYLKTRNLSAAIVVLKHILRPTSAIQSHSSGLLLFACITRKPRPVGQMGFSRIITCGYPELVIEFGLVSTALKTGFSGWRSSQPQSDS